jgi:hypothetical protein
MENGEHGGQNDETAQRRPYEKPTVTQVPLRPDEAVLGACKNAGTAGPAGGFCSLTMCSTLAS